MNCDEFLAWLDDAAAALQQPAADAHARGCARCARQLAVTLRVDALLAAPLPGARAGLAQRVMQRVHEAGTPASSPATPALAPAQFGWRQILAEPAIVFPGIAVLLVALIACSAAVPGAASHIGPGLAALRQLAADGGRSLSAMTPRGTSLPLALLTCAALASAAWFATRGPGFRAR